MCSSMVNVSQDFIERKKHKNKINETNMQSCYVVAALHYLAACPISFILSHDLPDKEKKTETSNTTQHNTFSCHVFKKSEKILNEAHESLIKKAQLNSEKKLLKQFLLKYIF